MHQVAHNAWRGISPEEWDDDLHKRNTLPLQVAPEPRDLRAINTTDAGPGIEALPAACQAVLDCGLAIVGGTFDLVKTAGSWAVHAASACAAAYSHNCMAHEQALFINRHPYITWISYITFGFGGGYFAGQLGADFPVDEASSKQLADCSGVSVLKSTEEYIKHCARGNAGINAQSIECAIDFKTCLACPRHEGKIKAQATPDMKGHKTHPGQCGVQGNTKRGMLLIGA